MESANTELYTARLRLRRFTPGDLQELTAIRADSAVMRFIGTGSPHGEEQVRAWLERDEKCWAQHGFGKWAVTFKGEAALIGWCGLAVLAETTEVEVGYGFARAHWGQGIAPEAAHVSLRFGFEERGLERIVAVALPDNAASRRVLEKVGMRYLREAFFYGADVVYYAVTRDQFQTNNPPS